jgi:hypothetical protein
MHVRPQKTVPPRCRIQRLCTIPVTQAMTMRELEKESNTPERARYQLPPLREQLPSPVLFLLSLRSPERSCRSERKEKLPFWIGLVEPRLDELNLFATSRINAKYIFRVSISAAASEANTR